ncbi:MAG TPA: hypothetical protein VLS90_15305, partial [Thermodesulfobacteriota bacterium]|nr:hypothetical protein [Thermodesulfobacteriota bacterium]
GGEGNGEKRMRKILILLLVVSVVNLYVPRVAFAQVGDIEEDITKNPPEMRSTPEENIPVETVRKGIPTWVWVGVGVLAAGAVAGIAAGAGGGGGGGGGSSAAPATGGSASGNKGSVAVGW